MNLLIDGIAVQADAVTYSDQLRGWVADDTLYLDPLRSYVLDDPEGQRATAKAARQSAVERIQVTTSTGKTFDGDETSQTRMARAIIGLQAAGVPAITWVLADNTPATVTLAELTEAMILAGQAQSALWVIS